MKIWLIQIGEILPLDQNAVKMRTALLADSLAKRGHSVLWWTSAFDHFKKVWLSRKEEEIKLKDGLNIFFLKGSGYRKNFSLSRFIDHRIIASKFSGLANQKVKPDIIVISTPPHDLAFKAVRFAKSYNIPVVVDIRDPWPDTLIENMPVLLKGCARMLLFWDFNNTKIMLKMADSLVAVTDGFFEWGLRQAGRLKTANDKVFYIGYKKNEIRHNDSITDKFRYLETVLKNKFIILFVGTITKSYHDPFVILEAAKKLKDLEDIHFIIAGDGEQFNNLRLKAHNLGNVTLTGWINQDEMEFFLEHSKIGLCPASKIIDVPTNKIYAYLSAGLPVISAFAGELKSLVEKYDIGFYYPPDSIDLLVDNIKRLHSDKNLYARLSKNAKTVFEDMFNADRIYENYSDHVERIAYCNIQGEKSDYA